MGKSRDTSGRGRSFVHAASVDEVQPIKMRIEALGDDWHDAVKEAGVSRNVGYTLLRGEGSIGSLRKIEEWLVRKESTTAAQRARDPRERWAQLLVELEELGVDQVDITVEALDEYIRAEKRRRAALQKILRATSR